MGTAIKWELLYILKDANKQLLTKSYNVNIRG